jgi:streptomycin 6-kinase
LQEDIEMIVVPEAFVASTIAREGDAGRAWLAELPGRVEALREHWRLVVDGAPMHGYLGLIVPVRRGDEACVLKISWPDDSTREEVAALRAWDGRGAVRLLETDAARNAILMERLDASRSLEQVGIAEAITIAGRLLHRLAIPDPGGMRGLDSLADQIARALSERWEQYGRPMPRNVLDQARDLAAELGMSTGGLLVNYDLHYGNVLAGMREPWLAIDPKAIVGDPEFGAAQLLWRRLEEIEAEGGLDACFDRLIDAAQLDPVLARAWTLVRCVDYWLWGLSVGFTEDPARCRRIVEWLT